MAPANQLNIVRKIKRQESSPPLEARRIFGLYKAEWLDEHLMRLFAEPTYFDELQTSKPCVLIGGRGTGKTTVLRGLGYELALQRLESRDPRNLPFIGLYHRVNTNKTSAFKGPELQEAQWERLFAHYINLTFCLLILRYVAWLKERAELQISLSPIALERTRVSLNLEKCESFEQLLARTDIALIAFEAALNNIADAVPSNLSMQCAPVDILTEVLAEVPAIKGKQFFFLLDEYENYENYQQRVLNTFLKHSNNYYTFKIGVRELGWRERVTLNAHEQLRHPADYVRIDISERLRADVFESFAREVCNSRLRIALKDAVPLDIRELLPSLQLNDEIRLLGGGALVDRLQASSTLSAETRRLIDELSFVERYFVAYEVLEAGSQLEDVVDAIRRDPRKWKVHCENHIFASLFTIRRRKRGIRKYYCGWDVFVRLADGNIRFLIELVHASLLKSDPDLDSLIPISPELQTIAAQEVGSKNVAELEGLSVDGARLTKLLLGLGRVFQVMAENPSGHAPEVNQFELSDRSADTHTGRIREDADKLLTQAVMHMALVRQPGNKLADESDIRDFDYMIHPIFAPFFVFSQRKKRKLRLSSSDLLGLVSDPHKVIRSILENQHRDLEDDDLPDQLRLFESFYDGSARH
jgi:hypothetical protein